MSHSGVELSETQFRMKWALGAQEENYPTDGAWSPWSDWSSCMGQCGQVGTSRRNRECTNPKPVNNGLECSGPKYQTRECLIKGCTLNDYRLLVRNDILRFHEFKEMQRIHTKCPALIDRCLKADCHFSFVYKILGSDADRYWNALHCVKRNVGCPVKGVWSEWGSWSRCSAHCGPGRQVRCRSCDSPTPPIISLACPGFNCTFQSCFGEDCTAFRGGWWSPWGEWTGCSATCGTGLKRRTRRCLKAEHLIPVICSNKKEKQLSNLSSPIPTYCLGSYEDLAPCYKQECPVDGGWSEWEPWSECSTECGIGVQSRSRACSKPATMWGGTPCSGPITAIRHCFMSPCPGKTHDVAVFSGDGSLVYPLTHHSCHLLHIFLHFRPSALTGELIRRYPEFCITQPCDEIKLFLEAGYLAFTALVSGSRISLITRKQLKLNNWHTVLLMLTGSGLTLRLDDSNDHYTQSFSIPPALTNLDHNMVVGNEFKGEIQKLAINFVPRKLTKPKSCEESLKVNEQGLCPQSNPNVAYDVSEEEESFKDLSLVIHAPCPTNGTNWSVELSIRPDAVDGYALLMRTATGNDFVLLSLETNRVWLTIATGNSVFECGEAMDINVAEWLHLLIDKTEVDIGLTVNGGERRAVTLSNEAKGYILCSRDILIGNVGGPFQEYSGEYSYNCSKVVQSLPGTLGFLKIDDEVIDLEKLPCETHWNRLFSSQSISYSEYYEELLLPVGEQLNLTCIFDMFLDEVDDETRIKQNSSNDLLWLRLDTLIKSRRNTSGVLYEVFADNHLTRLSVCSSPSRFEIESFYSCWAHTSKGLARFTFGVAVADRHREFLTWSTSILLCTLIYAIFLLVFSIGWLIFELIADFRKGSGFYRIQLMTKSLQKDYLSFILHSPYIKEYLGEEDKFESMRKLKGVNKSSNKPKGKSRFASIFKRQSIFRLEPKGMNDQSPVHKIKCNSFKSRVE